MTATLTEGPQGPPAPRSGPRAAIPAKTLRTDRWWAEPAITATVLLSFVAYSTWAAFQNANYYARPYLSPFYSPCIATICGHARAGSTTVHAPMVGIVGPWWAISPAILVLVVPLGFRFTCYYYRKAYYRSIWQSPVACAVKEPHKAYRGESRLPLILQNVHRYFFYLGLVLNCILTWDAIEAFHFANGWGMGLGTVVLVINASLSMDLFAFLPLVPAHSRRPPQAFLPAPHPFQALGLCLQAEREAYADRLGEPGLRRLHGPLCPPGGERVGTRPEVFLNGCRRNIRTPLI